MTRVDAVHVYRVTELWLDAAFNNVEKISSPDHQLRFVVPHFPTEAQDNSPESISQWNNRYFQEHVAGQYIIGGSIARPRYCVNALAMIVPADLYLTGDYKAQWTQAHEKEILGELRKTELLVDPVIRHMMDWIRTVGDQPRIGRFESGD